MPVRCLAAVLVFILAVAPGDASDRDSGIISGPLVVSDRWPECTDLLTWTRDVMRLEGLDRASETMRARAFFEWLRLFNRMATGGMIQAHEGEYGQETSVLDVHKNLFVYGWGFCDTHSRIAEAAWQQYTGDPASAERVITMHEDGSYHTMYRMRPDGNYGANDARYGYFLSRFNGVDVSIHGKYRFQLRQQGEEGAAVDGLKLSAWFETGIMSIPQIFDGVNKIRFKVADASLVRGPITVKYRYETASGEEEHRQVLERSDFSGNEAVYTIDAPGLVRCNSLEISYR